MDEQAVEILEALEDYYANPQNYSLSDLEDIFQDRDPIEFLQGIPSLGEPTPAASDPLRHTLRFPRLNVVGQMYNRVIRKETNAYSFKRPQGC